MSCRRGFSLLEALVVAVVALGLIGVAWGLLGGAARQGRLAEGKIQAVQASLLATVSLQRDLGTLEEGRRGLAPPLARTGIAGTSLSFLRRDPTPGAPPEVVTWEHDTDAGTLTRRVGSGPPRTVAGRIEDFLVRVVGPGAREGPAVLYTLVGGTRDPGSAQTQARTRRSVLVGGAPRLGGGTAPWVRAWNPPREGPPPAP